MQTAQNQEPKTGKLPEAIADIIRKNPLFWQGEGETTGQETTSDGKEKLREQIKQRESLRNALDSERKQIRNERITESKEGLIEESTEKDDEDDYFISKPVNSAFEINIAEFPIAYLNSGKLPEGVSKTKYKYNDIIKGRDGKPVERVWTIEAHATQEVTNENGEKDSVQLGFGWLIDTRSDLRAFSALERTRLYRTKNPHRNLLQPSATLRVGERQFSIQTA